MISIGIFHTKGGVAKSAVTVFLADFLSSLHGQRVLVVDLDPQGSSSRALIPSDEIGAGFSQNKSLTTLLRYACNGEVTKPTADTCLFHRPAMGPKRSSGAYKKTRSALEHLERLKAIPPLFSKDAEVLHRPEAQRATDWKSEESKTLVARYGTATNPFHVGLRKLAKEVMERLGKASDRDRLSVVANLRRKMTDYWRG